VAKQRSKPRRNRSSPAAGNRPGNSRRVPDARRDRTAAAREAQAREEARARKKRAITVIATVIAVLAVVVITGLLARSHPKSGTATSVAPASVVQQVASVPPSVFAQVGSGDASGGPKKVSGHPVPDVAGHPTVLFIGAEWCPFCAAERWPMVVALSRFGTFTGLGRTASSPSDSYPNTQSFSLHGSTYTSQYLGLVAKELQSNQVSGGSYTTLDRLTAQENKNFEAAHSAFPYVNIAGRYLMPTQFDPKVLHGKTMEQIAAALSDPTTDIAKAVDGAANIFTATLCTLTNDQPANVCTAAPIPALESAISGGS
jgi:thiol-disulfide isomerase/thioredoxin